MCYDTHARPPLPPIAGGAATGERFTLTASDGTELAAFSARAERGPGGPGIVVLPDVRGLHPFYEDLALRFAESGTHAVAMDYFGRTAGVGWRDESFEFMPHVMQTRPDSIVADVAACVARLRSDEGGAATAVFTVGFCFGGGNSFVQATRGHGLAGVIGFYGRVKGRQPDDPGAPVKLVDAFACPVLGLFGGADQGIPVSDVQDFRRALDGAGVGNEIVVYDGAPHSFFDRSFTEHKDACDDAWRRILAFIERNS